MIMLNQHKVTAMYGRGRSSLYADIAHGLFVKPVKLGKSSRWPDTEVNQIIEVIVAGWSEDQIRELVKKLEADRRKK